MKILGGIIMKMFEKVGLILASYHGDVMLFSLCFRASKKSIKPSQIMKMVSVQYDNVPI